MSSVATDWIKIYKEKIVPKLEKLEVERRKRLSAGLNWIGLAAFSVVFCIAGVIFCIKTNLYDVLPIFVFILFASPIVPIIVFIDENKKFIKYAKKKCIDDCIEALGGRFWTSGVIPFSPETSENTGLFSKWSHYVTDDNFSGEFNGVKYEIIETKLLKRIELHKGHTFITAFQGIIIQFACNKKIGTRTIVATQGDTNILGLPTGTAALGIGCLIFLLFPYIISGYWVFNKDALTMQLLYILFPLGTFIWQVVQIIIEKQKLKDLKRIVLEDTAWNKRFKVYSNDEVEARYLVTPGFMERFLRLNTAFGTKKAKCAFYEDKIMFAISTKKNLFEIGNLYKPINSREQLEKFFYEYKSIIDMIEYFKLNEETRL